MQPKHLCKRGSGYIYRCRVPVDLLHCFPSPIIWGNLHTTEKKSALILLAAVEYRTQQLFMQLRSGMLPKDLEKRLVAMYLQHGIEKLELVATGQSEGLDQKHERYAADIATAKDLPPKLARASLARANASVSDRYVQRLASMDTSVLNGPMKDWVQYFKRTHGITLSAKERRAFALNIMNASKQYYEVKADIYKGDWSSLERLREKVERDLRGSYCSLKTAIEKHKEKYLADKPNVKKGTKDDVLVECRVLEEIFGNISIAEFNTMESVTKLKKILAKYPKNKRQRYGDRSIHSILKIESGYQCISLKTANTYISRAKAVVDTARKASLLNSANAYVDELFETETAAEEQRAAYDNEDIRRLMRAICKEDLYRYGDPKPERFWIILIAVFHGFRLGNIVTLTKEDIAQTDKGTWVFLLRQGKTRGTVRPVAICDVLLLLGFLEWVEKLPRRKLFQDSSRSFSSWYNRDEVHKSGSITRGFESRHVTADKKKCLYSLRHTFAGSVFDITGDFKITSDMMGHSTGRSVTARYIKRTKTETLKQVADKMDLEHIDLDMLEARAADLFFGGSL